MQPTDFVVIPEQTIGEAVLTHFSVTEEELNMYNLRLTMNGSGYRRMKAGTYMQLNVGGTLMMSNTQAELQDLWPLHFNATGHVLMTGLGLGCAVQVALEQEKVTRVTVIEKSQDVIVLVGPHLDKKYPGKIEYICADALDWKPPKRQRYDSAWHDIWPTICADHLRRQQTGNEQTKTPLWTANRMARMLV